MVARDRTLAGESTTSACQRNAGRPWQPAVSLFSQTQRPQPPRLPKFVDTRMKFMILVKSDPQLEKLIETMEPAAMKASMAKMEAFNEELRKAGVMKDCDGLHTSRHGKRVRFDGDARSVTNGPFEGDLVAGYWIWELPNIEEAVAWVKRCPNPMPAPSDIEIRPFWQVDGEG